MAAYSCPFKNFRDPSSSDETFGFSHLRLVGTKLFWNNVGIHLPAWRTMTAKDPWSEIKIKLKHLKNLSPEIFERPIIEPPLHPVKIEPKFETRREGPQ
jgi:hypothetical protein